mgnify:FL=1
MKDRNLRCDICRDRLGSTFYVVDNYYLCEECEGMTPLEIFEYKNRWKPGYVVTVHSDLEDRCIEYCKETLDITRWAMERFTDVYAHSFMFENKEDAKSFEQWFV